MTGISGKLKIIIGLLLGIVSFPLIIIGIVYLVTISPANIWGWMFIGFGFAIIFLTATLFTTLKGTTSSRYDTGFDAE